jgi:cation transport regulator ChaB
VEARAARSAQQRPHRVRHRLQQRQQRLSTREFIATISMYYYCNDMERRWRGTGEPAPVR